MATDHRRRGDGPEDLTRHRRQPGHVRRIVGPEVTQALRDQRHHRPDELANVDVRIVDDAPHNDGPGHGLAAERDGRHELAVPRHHRERIGRRIVHPLDRVVERRFAHPRDPADVAMHVHCRHPLRRGARRRLVQLGQTVDVLGLGVADRVLRCVRLWGRRRGDGRQESAKAETERDGVRVA